jgi:hypothetical protein
MFAIGCQLAAASFILLKFGNGPRKNPVTQIGILRIEYCLACGLGFGLAEVAKNRPDRPQVVTK